MGMGNNMEDIEKMLYGNLEDDEDLEAELAALQGDDPPPRKSRQKQQEPVDLNKLDKMAAASMREVGSDEDMDDSDTEDPDLLAELQDLTTGDDGDSPMTSSPASPSKSGGGNQSVLVEERLTMYKAGISSAQVAGDTTKHKRLERGLKTLQNLHRSVMTGKTIDEADIPPPIAASANKPLAEPPIDYDERSNSMKDNPSPQRSLPSPEKKMAPNPTPTAAPGSSLSSEDQEKFNMLSTRRDQYKHAALEAKRANDIATATKYVKISKQFDQVIAALEVGNEIDLSQMPLPPSSMSSTPVPPSLEKKVTIPEVHVERSSNQATGNGAAENEPEFPTMSAEDQKKMFNSPDAPKTVLEALTQRLQKYQSSTDTAKEAGDSGKSRRMGRIVKQYQDAIKAHKAGRAVDYEDLPTPPGFGPIPVASKPQAAASPTPQTGPSPKLVPDSRPQRQPSPKPTAAARTPLKMPDPSETDIRRMASQKKSPSSRQEQQLNFLKERQNEYRNAAMHAKKNSDLELAKRYLRMAKGFDPMIEASMSGLPVDLSKIPPSLSDPDDDDKFALVDADDSIPTGDRDEVYKKLQADLIQQIRTSATNGQHYSKLGDVMATSKFQKMEQNGRKDLESLKNAFQHGDPVPKFHYETKTFSMVQCNTELADTIMELTVVRGIQLCLPSGFSPKDLDTYVKFEFPFPNDDPQVSQTEVVKSTNSPEYGEPFRLTINRKARGLARVVEKKGLKLEVMYKRGFLKSDKILGTVTAKLQALETQCTLHDSFDLMDGRKSVGGKLEVKLRIRDPLKSKQVEEVKEKWLVIDQFLRTLNPKSDSSKGPAPKTPSSQGTFCIEVLKYEKQQLMKQISYLKDSLSQTQSQVFNHKCHLLQERIDSQQATLKQGGTEAWRAYVNKVEAEVPHFALEAQHLAKQGDIQKAQTILMKKTLAEKELAAIRAKLPNM